MGQSAVVVPKTLAAAAARPAPRLASSGGIELTLGEHGGGLSLHVREDRPQPEAPQPSTPAERILGALFGAPAPLTRRELRDAAAYATPP